MKKDLQKIWEFTKSIDDFPMFLIIMCLLAAAYNIINAEIINLILAGFNIGMAIGILLNELEEYNEQDYR